MYESCCWVEENTYDEVCGIISLHPIIVYSHVSVEARSGVYMRGAAGCIDYVGDPHAVQH